MRKVFIVSASGPEAYGHYQDTVKRKRSIAEMAGYINQEQREYLNSLYHGRDFAVWGTTGGSGNVSTWTKMEPGDYVVFYQQGKFILIGEVAHKLKSKKLASYFWGSNRKGETWENVYFIINERETNIPLEKFNQYLGYKKNYTPQGFSAVEVERQKAFEKRYGDFYGLMLKVDEGKSDDIQEIGRYLMEHKVKLPQKEEEKMPTEHNEIQWRLIRLGKSAGNDVWVPRADQNKVYQGNKFRDFVLREFEQGLDIPRTVENIDCVWRYGFQIKSAFEIEHSTAIYSGILRLSDLKSIAPNSNYPLIIVAPREARPRVYEQIRRPTFSNPYLKLNEALKFLSYEKIRELDDKFSNTNILTTEIIIGSAERVNNYSI